MLFKCYIIFFICYLETQLLQSSDQQKYSKTKEATETNLSMHFSTKPSYMKNDNFSYLFQYQRVRTKFSRSQNTESFQYLPNPWN